MKWSKIRWNICTIFRALLRSHIKKVIKYTHAHLQTIQQKYLCFFIKNFEFPMSNLYMFQIIKNAFGSALLTQRKSIICSHSKPGNNFEQLPLLFFASTWQKVSIKFIILSHDPFGPSERSQGWLNLNQIQSQCFYLLCLIKGIFSLTSPCLGNICPLPICITMSPVKTKLQV